MFIPSPTMIKGFVALTIILAVGLPIYFHFQKDNAREAAIVQLETDKVKLLLSNASLEKEIVKIEGEKTLINHENKTLRDGEVSAFRKISQMEQQRDSTERQERVKAIEAGGKAKLLLKLANSAAKCQLIHYQDYNGHCRIGTWIPNTKSASKPID